MIRQSSQQTTITSQLGARISSATAGTVTFTIDPADGSANYQISPHAGGSSQLLLGDRVIASTGTYNIDPCRNK